MSGNRRSIRLSSAVLKTPIQLHGRPTRDLPGEEKEMDLNLNYDRQLLEIHQRGKLVLVVPLADVGPMTPAEKGCTCSICGAGFDDTQGLGPHMRHRHGVKSSET